MTAETISQTDPAAPLAWAFQGASDLHARGKWQEAEQLYGAILRLKPDHFGALCGLGALRGQQGNFDAAVRVLRLAACVARPSADAYTRLGRMFAAVNRLEDAIAHYRRALALTEDHGEAHHHLATALLKLNRVEAAVTHYNKALLVRPDDADTHNNLAIALEQLGSLDEALVHYQTALALRPNAIGAHSNLGNVLRALGRPKDAVAHYEQALAIAPADADVHCNLGNALQALGRCHEAIAHYRTALAIKPAFATAHTNLGNVLRRLGAPHKAIAHYRRALAIAPNDAASHGNLGAVLLALDDALQAKACFETALALDPDIGEWHHGAGLALQVLGHLEEARQALERAVARAPRCAAFHLTLAYSRPFTAGDPRLEALEDLVRDRSELGEEDQIALHFALGKGYADLRRHHESFQHLGMGNALKRRSVDYDEAGTLGMFERIRAIFTPTLMREKRGTGDLSPLPIFVVGMPRSGTTLVEQILASHSRVFGAGERDDLSAAAAKLSAAGEAVGFPEVVSSLSGPALSHVGASYLGRISARAPTAERIVDKMPANFALIGLIHLALPGARIIHVRRDPLDTCLSCFSILFVGHLPYTYELGELGRYYRAYVRMMDHWRAVLPDGVLLEVQYEHLVADLEGQAQAILAHCGLSWEHACLAFHETRRPVQTASSVQVRQPIYRSSVGRWRHYANELTPLLQALELSPASGAVGIGPT